MLQNRLGTRTKTSQTRVFCAFAVYLPLYQAVNFPKMIDRISLRFRFDRPFERPFRNQFSELAPGPQHSVQKIPSNGMQNLPIFSLAVLSFLNSLLTLCITIMCAIRHYFPFLDEAWWGKVLRLFYFFCYFCKMFSKDTCQCLPFSAIFSQHFQA